MKNLTLWSFIGLIVGSSLCSAQNYELVNADLNSGGEASSSAHYESKDILKTASVEAGEQSSATYSVNPLEIIQVPVELSQFSAE